MSTLPILDRVPVEVCWPRHPTTRRRILGSPRRRECERRSSGTQRSRKGYCVASEASFMGTATRKRTLDELKDAVEELSERQSLAEGLGQSGAKPAEPAPKRPLTFVSIPNKVNPGLSHRSRVGTI